MHSYLHITFVMRRKPGTLVPLEHSILSAAAERIARGEGDFHGYGIAREMQDRGDSRQLTAYGTLYRALERLEGFGFLESHWEDPEAAALERRPVRRIYRLTAAGERALRRADAPERAKPSLQTGPAPS
jgi:DNA-binding PadR family transcriptional regulator